MSSRSIHFVSLGCAKNRVDTEVMLGVSHQSGFHFEHNPEEAEVIVVNTCGFIGPAKEESVDTILEMAQLKENGKCKTLVVAGCLSQRYSETLMNEMPEVDHFLGSSDMLKLGNILDRDVLDKYAPRMWVGNPADHVMRATDPRRLSQWGHSAYVKIAEGCNRICSFCSIPSFRGKQRSRSIEDVVEEVKALASQGVREVNLVSQDTIAYGRDRTERPSLAKLLQALGDIDELRWVRAHYLYPETLSAELVEVIAQHPKVLPYIDMPLQHASDSMLMRMKRGHGGKRLYRVVETLKKNIDDLVFRTTFIVGHPGETDADFDELNAFVKWAEFDHVGVFLYSHEEGTTSGSMQDDVDDEIKQERQKRLLEIQQPISRKKLQSRVGQTLEVLVDGTSEESEYFLEGRYWGQAPEVDGKVFLANGQAKAGELIKAKVTASAEYDLLADILGEGDRHDAPDEAPTVKAPFRLPTLP